jgi:hypothetical protein
MAQKGMISPFEFSLIRKLQPDPSQIPQPVILMAMISVFLHLNFGFFATFLVLSLILKILIPKI